MPDVVPGKDLRLPDPVDGVLGVVTGRGRVVPPASPVSVPDSKKQSVLPSSALGAQGWQRKQGHQEIWVFLVNCNSAF